MTTPSSITNFARASAVLLTIGLFTVGSTPNAGDVFAGGMHWVAHLVAYALIAFAFGLGWPKRPVAHIAILVAVIGAVHEMSEISTHNHAFEIVDAIVNAVGAVLGVAIQRATYRAATQWIQ